MKILKEGKQNFKPVMGSRSQIGCKADRRKTICHCNHINIQMSGHNCGEKRDASKLDCHQASPFPKTDRANCCL